MRFWSMPNCHQCSPAGWRGHEAEHISDIGISGATDPAIWDHVASVDAIIVKNGGDEGAADRAEPFGRPDRARRLVGLQ
jgi:predicted nuclease of predicted toxin-antitoxin system